MLRILFAIICILLCRVAMSASPAPTSVALDPSSNTGLSTSDMITNLDNSTPARVLKFNVTGTVPGATVTIDEFGTVVGSAVATGTTTQVVTDGSHPLGVSNIQEQIGATQTLPGDTASTGVYTFIAIDSSAPPAPPGMLDRTFGTNGRVVTAFRQNSQVLAVAVQTDGKIVTGGVTSQAFSTDDFALVRYLPNGALDPAFGSGGEVQLDFSSRHDQINAITLLGDGRILAVGTSRFSPQNLGAAARFNSDGTLDTTFGTGGRATFAFGTSTTYITGVALQSDGKALMCGQYDTSAAFVARIKTDGTLDTSFGTNGVTLVSGFGHFTGIKVLPDDRFYAGGSLNSAFIVSRFTSSGSLDSGFGSGGTVALRVDSNTSIGQCLELQSDGKPVIAGSSFIPATFRQQVALARYDTSGNLDAGFGSGGIVKTSITSGNDTATSIAIQPDGKLVAAGMGKNFTAVRYNTNGTLDSTFGSGGTTTIAITDYPTAQSNALALQADGTIVIAGQAGRFGGDDMAVVRLVAQAPTQCLALDPASDTGVVGDNSTAVANPTLDVLSSDLYYRIYDNGEQVSNDYETASTFAITPLSDGTHTITTCSVDAAGNVSSAGNPLLLTISGGAPLITMTYLPATPTFNDVVHVDIQFDQTVTGLTSSEIQLTDATLVGLSGSGSHYTLDIQPLTFGTATVFIPGASAINSSNVGNVRSRLTIPIDKVTPIITWNTPANITYGTPLPAAILNASASVAGTFSYTPSAGTVLNAGPQTLSVLFTPTSPSYKTAIATVSLTIDRATPGITWSNPANIVYGTVLSSTQLNAVATVTGTYSYLPLSGTVLDAGTQPLNLHFTPQDLSNYVPVDAQVNLNVQPAAPVVTWAPPPSFEYGTPLSAVQLNASANTPGTFNYTPGPLTILNAGIQTLNLQFVPASANYLNANVSRTINVLQQQALASWANPADISEATPLSDAQLNASTPIAGHFVYNPPKGTRLSPGQYTLSATLVPLDTVDFSAPPVLTVMIQVVAVPVLQSVQMPVVLQVNESGDFFADSTGYGNPTVSWDFGDGTHASANSVAHSFRVAGTYTVTVSSTDVLGGSTSTTAAVVVLPLGTGNQTDSDGDGFPDSVEVAAGTSPSNGTDTPFGGTTAGSPLTLQVTKLSIGLNFLKTGADSISMTGALPLSNQNSDSQPTVIFDAGGVVTVFNLTNGSARNGHDQFRLAFNKKTPTATFTAQLKGSFRNTLATSNLTADQDVKGAQRTILVTVYCMNQKFQGQVTRSWTAKKGKSGALR